MDFDVQLLQSYAIAEIAIKTVGFFDNENPNRMALFEKTGHRLKLLSSCPLWRFSTSANSRAISNSCERAYSQSWRHQLANRSLARPRPLKRIQQLSGTPGIYIVVKCSDPSKFVLNVVCTLSLANGNTANQYYCHGDST
jgi:hypothetical protein